ncbi:hypothetical protein [Parasitella parasitica]|uniref:Bromo domain-containing protein n=1 Tax=Parasitella parasitica TaxID=35722 RepID=A0A0B7ND14_9FUNG|nr:hypothetical protein [Parasitella parasitica]
MSTTGWTILEKLLLSQAVYKFGEDNWFHIAKNLKHHALLDRPSDYFNQKNCSHQYYSMVQDITKEQKNVLSNDMPAVVQLARHLYNLRLEELKQAINEDEEKFLSLVAEIDEIRAGKWDNRLLGLSSTSEADTTLEETESANTPTAVSDTNTAAQEEALENTTSPITNTSYKQASSSPSDGQSLEKLAQQEIEAEEAAKVESENIQNETRDVRTDDAPPISVEEQQQDNTETKETPSLKVDQDIKTPTEETLPSDNVSSEMPRDKQSSSPKKPSTSEDISEPMSLKRQRDDNEDVQASELKRQRSDNQPAFSAESVAEKLAHHTDMEEDKNSKKSRANDREPLQIDTSRTDYSTDASRVTTPADLREGTESVAGSESNAATPTNERGSRRRDDQRNKSWLKNINLLWREIANHKNGAMFMNPIKETNAPQYYEIVKRPMDLKTIKARIRDGTINTTIEFERDIVLMLNNSLMYNKEGTEVYLLAKEMLDDAVEQIKVFKTADTDTTASSHTRAATKKSAVPE